MRRLPSHSAGLPRGRHVLSAIAALLLLVSIPACGVSPTNSLPAEQLDVTLTVIEDHLQAGVTVYMTFHHGSKAVTFVQDTVTCNEMELRLQSDSTQYYGFLPSVPAGGVYRCSYSIITMDYLGRSHNDDGARATVDVVAREPPVILTPHAGDKLPRAHPLTVTYAAASSAGVTAVAYDTHNAFSAYGLYYASQSNPYLRADTGTYDDIDVSALSEGEGSVVVIREYTDTPTGTSFQSAQTTYYGVASIDVVWT
jgi:hypothetical protein